MFRQFSRIPLRRCLHTSTRAQSPARSRVGFVVGASAVATAYLTWKVAAEHNHIALDALDELPSPVKSPLQPRKADSKNAVLTTALDKNSSNTSTTEQADISSVFEKDNEPSSEEPFSTTPPTSDTTVETSNDTETTGDEEPSSGGGGAYNPVTGEINWDCPCLGGMAYGPCGPEFREAFSCFIHSEDEPKGINCVEKFKGMQDCFRAHPEVYADEIMDDDEEEAESAKDVGETGSTPPEKDGSAFPTTESNLLSSETPLPEALEKTGESSGISS